MVGLVVHHGGGSLIVRDGHIRAPGGAINEFEF